MFKSFFFFSKFPTKGLRSLMKETCIVNFFPTDLLRQVVGAEQRTQCEKTTKELSG